MMSMFDRYIIRRLFTITLFVLGVLIFIFIVLDFSENSDDFTDQGATFQAIWNEYYLNYIPEMIRLVMPMAIFTACLFLTGQLSERLEITALKAAGISLYRLFAPYLAFAITMAVVVSALDSYIIPKSNQKRIAFEDQYIKKKNEKIDRSEIYRQPTPNSILRINFFDGRKNIGYQIRMIEFEGKEVSKTMVANKMTWIDSTQSWKLNAVTERTYHPSGFDERNKQELDTTLTLYPRDLARKTSDVYQLSYAEAQEYISSILRSGAGSVNIPKVHFYGRLAYPFSLPVVILVGFAVASVRHRGGKGIYIGAGLSISFLYLAFMKIIEPFGYYGAISPWMAATIAHLFFLVVGIIMLIKAKK